MRSRGLSINCNSGTGDSLDLHLAETPQERGNLLMQVYPADWETAHSDTWIYLTPDSARQMMNFLRAYLRTQP